MRLSIGSALNESLLSLRRINVRFEVQTFLSFSVRRISIVISIPHSFSLIARACIVFGMALAISYSAPRAGAATPEERARFVLKQLDAAGQAKDLVAVARLLSDDCIIVMTDPAQGSKATRFFNHVEPFQGAHSSARGAAGMRLVGKGGKVVGADEKSCSLFEEM